MPTASELRTWSNEELINHLCHSPDSSWSPPNDASGREILEEIGERFKQHGVDGKSFMGITIQEMKQFGLTLNARTTLLKFHDSVEEDSPKASEGKKRIAPTLVGPPMSASEGGVLSTQATHNGTHDPDGDEIASCEVADRHDQQTTKYLPPAHASEAMDHPPDDGWHEDYDYLLKRWPPGGDADAGLPFYGESDSEEEYDIETAKAIEAEQAETAGNDADSALSTVQVNETIDRAIAEYEADWQERKRIGVQNEAYNRWRQVTASNTRTQAHNTASKLLRRHRELLEKMKDGLRAGTWQSINDLKNVCVNMELKVHQIKEQEWYCEVFDKAESPEKAQEEKIVRGQKPSDLEGDDEYIGSDSDNSLEMETDSYEDFVEEELGPESDNALETGTDSDEDFVEDELGSRAASPQKGKQKALAPSPYDDTNMDLDDDVVSPRRPTIVDLEEPDDGTSNEVASASRPTPRRRNRESFEDHDVEEQQKDDKARVERQEKRRLEIEAQFAGTGMNNTAAQIIVNAKEPAIFLHHDIASRIKPHQVKGVRFMWREILADPKQLGCLLSHTMGLGKTMQVATLLIMIAQCNASTVAGVKDQIPRHLQDDKSLILCPAALLNNWEDELLAWTPPSVELKVWKVDGKDVSANAKLVRSWNRSGGVLLLSYGRFKSMVKSNPDKGKSDAGLRMILLNEPGLIVADEAHELKNSESMVARETKCFVTKSRIALTGSPLSNNLEEYYSIVDWIAPGYLGDRRYFRKEYANPIREGLYTDSSEDERRLSLRKLLLLKLNLEPKVDRADITAISDTLPQKTEYFITVPLTEPQTQAYNKVVEVIKNWTKEEGEKKTSYLEYASLLAWLCQHPSGFVRRLNSKLSELTTDVNPAEATSMGQKGVLDDSDDDAPSTTEVQEDLRIEGNGGLIRALQPVLDLLPGEKEDALDRPNLSYRAVAVKRIVEKAVDAGDKTLIFSHSIPTLEFLARMLKNMECRFLVITGDSATSRQQLIKDFNSTPEYSVLLISVKAGGVGLNIQSANRVVMFDFSWNPVHEAQAIARAYRMGQERHVFVYRFQAGGTFEDIVFNRSIFKTHLFGRVVDKKTLVRHAHTGLDENHLCPVKDVPQQDLTDIKGKDPQVLDAIINEVTFIRSVVFTETFQKEENEPFTEEEQKKANAEFQTQQNAHEDGREPPRGSGDLPQRTGMAGPSRAKNNPARSAQHSAQHSDEKGDIFSTEGCKIWKPSQEVYAELEGKGIDITTLNDHRGEGTLLESLKGKHQSKFAALNKEAKGKLDRLARLVRVNGRKAITFSVFVVMALEGLVLPQLEEIREGFVRDAGEDDRRVTNTDTRLQAAQRLRDRFAALALRLCSGETVVLDEDDEQNTEILVELSDDSEQEEAGSEGEMDRGDSRAGCDNRDDPIVLD